MTTATPRLYFDHAGPVPAPLVEEEHRLVFTIDDRVWLITERWVDDRALPDDRRLLGHIDGIEVLDLPESVRERFLAEVDLQRDAVSHEMSARDAWNDSRGRF